MTAEIYNALPLEARRYIETNSGCLSCGKKTDLDSLYKKYLNMKNISLYTLRNGAVSFLDKKTNERSILYPLQNSDTELETKEKLKLALKINSIRDDRFSFIDVEKIKEILKPEPKPKKTKKVIEEETNEAE